MKLKRYRLTVIGSFADVAKLLEWINHDIENCYVRFEPILVTADETKTAPAVTITPAPAVPAPIIKTPEPPVSDHIVSQKPKRPRYANGRHLKDVLAQDLMLIVFHEKGPMTRDDLVPFFVYYGFASTTPHPVYYCLRRDGFIEEAPSGLATLTPKGIHEAERLLAQKQKVFLGTPELLRQ